MKTGEERKNVRQTLERKVEARGGGGVGKRRRRRKKERCREEMREGFILFPRQGVRRGGSRWSRRRWWWWSRRSRWSRWRSRRRPNCHIVETRRCGRRSVANN